VVYKEMGLGPQVFDEPTLNSLIGHVAIGHTRYSTTGSSVWENAQPTFRSTPTGSAALAHNGNLTNTGDLAELVANQCNLDRERMRRQGGQAASTDTDLVTELLASHPSRSLEAAAMDLLPQLKGAFSFVFMDESTLSSAPPASARSSPAR